MIPLVLLFSIWIVFFDALLNEHSGALETIDQFFLVFLLNLGERLNPLSSLFFKEDVLRICDLNEFLS